MQVSQAAKETGTDIPHERLFSPALNIAEPGFVCRSFSGGRYVYIYISNEETTSVSVFFDDFSVTQVKTPIVQVEDYYPFGLTFNSYQRDSSMPDQYLYNGKELQDELSLGWLDYGARMYMPELGRWNSTDPLSDSYRRWSPYTYGVNNPLKFTDPDGMKVRVINESDQEMVRLTVSEDEAKYIKFNKNGELNKRELRKGKRALGAVSENFKSLKTLAKSSNEYVVSVSDSRGDFERTTNGEVMDNWGPRKKDATPDDVANLNFSQSLGETSEVNANGSLVNIKIHGGQTKEEQAETFAHEAYGHAFLHSQNRDAKNDGAYWKHDRGFSETEIKPDQNTRLDKRIERAEKLTRTFIEQRKK